MNVLALDTALRMNCLSISVKSDAGIFTRSCDFSERLVAENLFSSLELSLTEAGIARTAIDVCLVPEGPGSFTGLRLAYSVAKALQLSSAARFIAIPTLNCLAASVFPYKGNLLVAIDARRNSVYAQHFKNAEAVSEIFDTPFSQLLSDFEQSEAICLCVGYDAILRHLEQSSYRAEHISQLQFIEYKNIFSLDLLQYFLNHQNELLSTASADYAGPLYVRKSDATV